MGAEQIDPIQGFQCGLGHSDGTGVSFRESVISLVPSFPDAVIARAVRLGDVMHEALQEICFITAADHGQSGLGQLGKLQEEQGCCIQLQMPPSVISHHGVSAVAVVFRVEGIKRVKAVFEPFHLVGLAHHRAQQPAHQGQDPFIQLPAAAGSFAETPSMRDGEGPDALHRIDTVTNPGIPVVAVHGVGRAGR